MAEYRVRWNIENSPHEYGSEVTTDLEEAYEYRDSIKGHTARIWIEAARWEVFDEMTEELSQIPS